MRVRVILYEEDGTEVDSSDFKLNTRNEGFTAFDAVQQVIAERDEFSWKRIAQLLHRRLDELTTAVTILRRVMGLSDGVELIEAAITLRDSLNTAPAETALAEARMKDGFFHRASFGAPPQELLPRSYYERYGNPPR